MSYAILRAKPAGEKSFPAIPCSFSERNCPSLAGD
jgi:hypothetical protein